MAGTALAGRHLSRIQPVLASLAAGGAGTGVV